MDDLHGRSVVAFNSVSVAALRAMMDVFSPSYPCQVTLGLFPKSPMFVVAARLHNVRARLAPPKGISGRAVCWMLSVTSGVDTAGSTMRPTAIRLSIIGRKCAFPCERQVIGSSSPTSSWGCSQMLTQPGRLLMWTPYLSSGRNITLIASVVDNYPIVL